MNLKKLKAFIRHLLGIKYPLLVDANPVIPGKSYRYYGRVLKACNNYKPYQLEYFVFRDNDYKKVSKDYYESFEGNKYAKADKDNCDECACNINGLPCKCDFKNGTATGYYKLIIK